MATKPTETTAPAKIDATDAPIKPKPTIAERVVAEARAAVGVGAHAPEEHASLLGDHEGSHAWGVLRGVLRRAGIDSPATIAALIDEARKRDAWVEPKGMMAQAMVVVRPPPASLLVLADGTPAEHVSLVLSSSMGHIESLDSAPQALRFGVARGEPTIDIGGPLVELRSRQWTVEQPRNAEGQAVGSAFIVDSAHHGLVEKRHPGRRVAGWVDVEKFAAGAPAKVAS